MTPRRPTPPALWALMALVALLALSALSASPASAQGEPVRGDTLVDASIGDASNLIPALSSDTASSGVSGQAYPGLVKYDENLEIAPDLAESWEFSNGDRTITFKLRPGLKWADGTPVTAADCVYTWRLMSDPDTPTAYGESFQQVESAEALDDLTFRVTFKRVMARALITWGFGIMPRHLLEGQDLDASPLARTTVGSGPFQLESWEAGQRIILKPNDLYYGGRPYLDRLVTRIIPDMTTQFMELETGRLDMMTLDPDQWLLAREKPELSQRLDFHTFMAFAYTYLGFNLRDPRLSDVRVRRAIALAIDKDEIVEGVLLGLGRVANGPFKPDMWAYNDKVAPHPHDPDGAKRLLAEAGWTDSDNDGVVDKDGRPFVLTISTNQGNRNREMTGLIIQERLKKVGIDVKLLTIEWAAFLKDFLDKGEFEAIIMGWTIPMDPDLFDVWNSGKTDPGELNFIGYKNPEVDELIDRARFTVDRAERKICYDRIQEILHEDVPYVFLYVPDALHVVSKRFVGPETAPAGLGWNLDRWWVPLDRQLYKQ
jgi:peptide/nickel transport system substrate-binding protein